MTPTRTLVLGFVASLLLALLLQLIRLPELLAAARPLWVPLILAYWALREPRISTLFPAFVTGLLLDVLFGTPLGQHSLGLVLLVYLVERMRSIFILFPLWQATLALIPAWVLFSFLMFWIDGATQHRADAWLRWLPVLSTTLFWPLLFSVMETLRQPDDDE
ncbi:rod shape-determining protein MreD [Fontimonas thermophila]|uniref:Rod shape-determining protein MreD n=1 Tax=Fontimonas thermophila TaxID=1076937 RepID=A0A1I2IYE2_9GAMM|nr:rod shape-determining protein MreD [Fontimonas thermophila]SFF47189.1 rod shape-determining protein MreD [Fontimonas thermophila]